MAKKIKLFPAPHVELRIHVSDEMVKDMHTCRRTVEATGSGPGCDKCSWDKVEISSDTGACELDEVVRQVMEMEENHETDRKR